MEAQTPTSFPRYHHHDARYGNAKRKRALPRAHRKHEAAIARRSSGTSAWAATLPHPNAIRELQRLGFMTTPVTVVNGDAIVGFDTAKIDAALGR